MASGKHFQARALERVEALAFEGADAAGRVPARIRRSGSP